MKNLTGQPFDRLTVIRFAGRDGKGNTLWLCRCCCRIGQELVVRGSSLVSRHTRSCGCLQREKVVRLKLIHGAARNQNKTREWVAWNHMLQRCYNPKHPRFKDWGGRGIAVHEAWRHSFGLFLQWMGPCPTGLTLERFNNNEGYVPGNVGWASRKKQQNNTRRNRMITFENRTQTLSQWSVEVGLNKNTLRKRLELGWPLVKALSKL